MLQAEVLPVLWCVFYLGKGQAITEGGGGKRRALITVERCAGLLELGEKAEETSRCQPCEVPRS